MRRPEKAERLIEYIEERLVSGHYAPGARIPSVRQLSRQFDISYGSALNGVNYLCELGKLEKSPNRGIFVSRTLPKSSSVKRQSIAVFMRLAEEMEVFLRMYYMAFLGMQDAAHQSGFSFLLHSLSREDATSEKIRVQSEGASGVIFLSEYEAVLDDLRLKMPAVGVMMENISNEAVSTVNLDPVSAARLAAGYFQSRGIRKVFIQSSTFPVYMTRGCVFDGIWRSMGGEVEWWEEFDDFQFQEGFGYLFTSDQRAQNQIEKSGQAEGKVMADRYAIMGMDGKQLINPGFYKFPTIAIDWRKMGRIAFDECLRRISSPGECAKNIMVNGRLYEPDAG